MANFTPAPKQKFPFSTVAIWLATAFGKRFGCIKVFWFFWMTILTDSGKGQPPSGWILA